MGNNKIYMRTFIAVLAAAVAVNAAPRLQNKGWSPKHKLGLCQGDCDHIHHCRKGLVCFTRGAAHKGAKAQAFSDNPYQRIPGCKGRGVSSMDYCVKPKQLSEFKKDRKKFMGAKWYARFLKTRKIWRARLKKRLAAHRRRVAAARRRHAKRLAAHRRRIRAHRKRMAAKRRAHAKRMRAHRRRVLAHRRRIAAHRRRMRAIRRH